MEFFERAHIAKTKDCSRKETKSGENKKNQLKQMLYGFKHSDNKLIKESEDLKNDFETSSSVSGVSDLDLTNSSFEGDETQNCTTSDHNDASTCNNYLKSQDYKSSEVEIKDMEKHDSCQVLNPNKEISEDDSNVSRNDNTSPESLSDYDEEIQSLPDDVDDIQYPCSASDTMFDYTSDESSDNGSDGGDFDPDGLLAQKIIERLGESKENRKKSKKRKLEEINNLKPTKKINNDKKVNEYKGPFRPSDDIMEDVEMKSLETDMSNIELPTKQNMDSHNGNESSENSVSESLDSTLLDSSCDILEDLSEIEDMEESDDPAPFVSLIAANVPSQSLSDILGEYCHPTVRNLPFESQNTYSTDNSGIFATDDANITDLVEPGDEIGSLIPEIDNTDVVDDISISIPTDLDTNSQNPNEESIVYDETLQSENISEKEDSLNSINPIIINPIEVYYGKNSCILVMKHPAQIYIHGKVKVKPLGGTVEIFGYILQENTYNVYAPHYNFAQSMKTIENDNAFYGLFAKLTASGLSVSDAEEVVTSIGEYDAVVNLQPLTSRKIEYVQANFNVTDLFGKHNKNVDHCLRNASNSLGCSLYMSKPSKSLQEPVSWKQVIQYGLGKSLISLQLLLSNCNKFYCCL